MDTQISILETEVTTKRAEMDLAHDLNVHNRVEDGFCADDGNEEDAGDLNMTKILYESSENNCRMIYASQKAVLGK